MADTMAHGGDGGDRPPSWPAGGPLGRHYARVPLRNRQRRSPRELLEKWWRENNQQPLPIEFAMMNGRLRVVGSNVTYLNALVREQVRENIVPCYKHWNRIPTNERHSVLETVGMYFDVKGHGHGLRYGDAVEAVERVAKSHYYGYVSEAHAHYKEHGVNSMKRFGGLHLDQWLRCVDLFMYYQMAREISQLRRTIAQLQGNQNMNEGEDDNP